MIQGVAVNDDGSVLVAVSMWDEVLYDEKTKVEQYNSLSCYWQERLNEHDTSVCNIAFHSGGEHQFRLA